MKYRVVEYRNHPVTYRVYGSGKPLVLIHGFGEDGRIWEEIATALSSHHTILIPDLPGSGLSAGALAANSEWTMDDFAEIIELMLSKEGIKKSFVAGHSMGGYITLAFAERYPEKCSGIGLVHSTAMADNDEKIEVRKKGIQFILGHGADKFLAQLIPNLYGDAYRKKYPHRIEEQIEATKGFSSASLICYYEAMMKRPDRKHVLSHLQVPVLFLIGTADKAVNLSDSLSQCYLADISYVHILEESGHMGMQEDKEKTLCALRQFLGHQNEN